MFRAKTSLSRTRESTWEKEQAKALRDIRKERKEYRQQKQQTTWKTRISRILCCCVKAETETDIKQVLAVSSQLSIACFHVLIEYCCIHLCFYPTRCFYSFFYDIATLFNISFIHNFKNHRQTNSTAGDSVPPCQIVPSDIDRLDVHGIMLSRRCGARASWTTRGWGELWALQEYTGTIRRPRE